MAYEMQTRGFWKWNNFSFRDEQYGPGQGHSIFQYCPIPLMLDPSIGFNFFEDFEYADTTLKWVADESGAKTGPDVLLENKNGWYRFFTDGPDNASAALATVHEVFGLEAGKPLWFEAKIQLTEAQTDKANYAIGLAEVADNAFMTDNGAGPISPSDHIVWFKRDANMFLEFESSLAGAQVTRADVLAHVTAHVYRLGFYCKPATATTFTVYPWYVDETAGGTPVFSTALATTLTLTGWGPVQAFFTVKNGGAGAEESIDVDYIRIVQAR